MRTVDLFGKKGKIIIDKDDYECVKKHNWFLAGKGYACAFIKGKNVYLHRLLTSAKKGQIIDHINRNKLDNRKGNLRTCSYSQNQANLPAIKGSLSGYKGVSWCSELKKWRAQITYRGQYFHIGYFIKKKDAAVAYNDKAKKFFNDFAYLNKV